MRSNSKKYVLPNFLSILRLIGALGLLFTKTFSSTYFIVYTLCGISDVLDGWIARKTGTESEFGAKLDSIADLLFYVVMLLKLFPILWNNLPAELWFAVGIVVMIRLFSYGIAVWKYRRFASLHTYMNKLTGASVFLIPYALHYPFVVSYCWAACGIAMLASVEELLIHICNRRYCANLKTIFFREDRERSYWSPQKRNNSKKSRENS